MPYKKRRVPKAPNKNEERSRRNQNNLLPLKSYFPDVTRLTLDMSFINSRGNSLEPGHFEYGPSDSVNFLVTCPGGCNDGKTNLQGKIESLVRERATSGEGRAQCGEEIYTGDEICACRIECRINLSYA